MAGSWGKLRLSLFGFSMSALFLHLYSLMALGIAKNTPKYVYSGNSQLLQESFAGHLPVLLLKDFPNI